MSMTDASAEAPKETPKQASASVIAQHAATLKALPFSDTRDFDDAARGFLGTIENARIANPQGRVVWSLEPYGFLSAEEAPATVDPSLWRQSRLNMHHGLFEVVPGVYQVRGLDIANMTLIEGDSGVVVVDTLTSIEGARAAVELYFQHRGKRPVAAVIFTHTHTDHWGGARGVLDDETLSSGKVPIIAPNFFMEHAVSENIIAGPAMLRRAQYQFGPLLAKGVRGQVDCGLGKSMAAGSVALLRPTDLIIATGDRRSNHGLTAAEIAETIKLPASLDGAWHGRGYYGHIRHNVKAIYQKYLGWYDANPVNLDPLPPVESGRKYVEYMGGAEAILARAAKDFTKGEFRFVAQAVSHLVFAEPDNQAARAMLADTFEQLGYASESSTWRNAYLFGAQELRQGMPKVPPRSSMPRETLAALRTEQLWDVLGVRLNGPKAEGKRIVLNWNFTDTHESFILNLENCALTYAAGVQAPDADAGFTLPRGVLDELIAKLTTFPEAVGSGKIKVVGDPTRLAELMGLMDEFPRMFEIVEPKRTAVS